jgi:hypothetical protein
MGSIITSLGAGIVYPNQVTLPAVNADRAGEVFIHQGQAWRFTDGTEGWDLPVGTPWPVKGYKEWIGLLSQEGTNAPVASVKVDTIGITPTFERIEVGDYRATFTGIDVNFIIYPSSDIVLNGFETLISLQKLSFDSPVVIISSSEGESLSPTDGVLSDTIATIRIYPPLP